MALDDVVVEDKLDDGHLVLVALDVVLDVHSPELLRGGEALDLAVVDRLHERGLAAAVGAAETVALALLHVEGGVVEENERTVREGEVALAEVLALLVLDDEHLLARLVRGERLLDEVLRRVLGAVEEEREVGRRAGLLPRLEVKVLGEERVAAELADVLEVRLHLGGGEERGDVRLGGAGDLGHHRGHLRADGGLVRALGLGVLVDDGVRGLAGGDEERLVRAGAHLAALGVRDLVHGALQQGKELGEEGSSVHGVLDELAHVVDDDGGLALDGGLLLEEETALEEGAHDGERGRLNLLHEGGRGELVHALGHLVHLVDALDEGGDEGVDVDVADARANLGHRVGGLLLHLLAHVNHHLSELGDDLGEARGDRLGVALDEGVDELERRHLGLPELGVEAGEDGAEARAHRKLGELRGERLARDIRRLADVLGLVVAREGDRDLEEVDEHGLLGVAGVVHQGGDLLSRRLARVLILLLEGVLLDRRDVGHRDLGRSRSLALRGSHRSCDGRGARDGDSRVGARKGVTVSREARAEARFRGADEGICEKASRSSR